MSNLLTEDFLKAVGFKWHQLERQPDKHWLLWINTEWGSCDEIGIEVAPNCPTDKTKWFCWFRSDTSGRYSRFVHVRHIRTEADLVRLVEAVSGQDWNVDNHWYGAVRTPEVAAKLKAESDRLDIKFASQNTWRDTEKDRFRGKALMEHRDVYEKDRGIPQ